MGEHLSTREVMALLGISRRTVQAWVKAGKLRPGKDAQGRNNAHGGSGGCIENDLSKETDRNLPSRERGGRPKRLPQAQEATN